MNNPFTYRIISIKQRRKHIAAIKFEPEFSPQGCRLEKDDKGLLLLDISLWEDGLIAENMELSEEEILALSAESYYRKAKSRALWQLSVASHSKKGLYKKLIRLYPEEACQKAVDKMEELGYIDDEKYAKNACEVLSSRGLSNSAIVAKLIASGVPSPLAKECVNDAANDQLEQIDYIIQKKYINRLGDEKSVEKVVAALARRGFSFRDIRSAIKKYTDTEFYEEC